MANQKDLTIATPGALQNLPKSPQTVQPNVIESGGQTKTAQPEVRPASVPDGYNGIRNTLVGRGVDNNRIGFNSETGYVTIDGQNAYKPEYNVNGTTYADKNAINGITSQAYAQAGNPLMAARDYVTQKGYSGVVEWDGNNGTVNIGGQALKPAYVTDDGIAYIPKSQLDTALAAMQTTAGIATNKGVLDSYDTKYDADVNEALNKLVNRKAFEYNPENDEVFKAYEKQYTRQAEDAFRKMLNDNNTSVHGASGAILAQAMAARDAEMDKITDVIPSLYADAYNRYIGETGRLRDNLNDVISAENDYYNKFYTANRDSIEDLITAGRYEDEVEQQIFENQITSDEHYYNMLNNALELGVKPEYLKAELENARLANKISEAEYQQMLYELTMSQASNRGEYVADDEAVLAWLKYYRTPDGKYSINPFSGENSYTYDQQYWAQKAVQDAKLGTYNRP